LGKVIMAPISRVVWTLRKPVVLEPLGDIPQVVPGRGSTDGFPA
jgi:hypothetical protein